MGLELLDDLIHITMVAFSLGLHKNISTLSYHTEETEAVMTTKI